MKYEFTVKALTKIVFLYVSFLGCIQCRDNGIYDNSDEAQLTREKESSNYYRLKSPGSDAFLKSDGVSNYKSTANKNKKRNQMMKVTDIKSLPANNKIHSLAPKGKKDPIAEEKVDPNHPNKIVARNPRKPGLTIGDKSLGMGAGNKLSLPNCGKTGDLGERIVNGKAATEGSHPWIVAILKDGDAWCGGSILNERWIITAAHCFMGDQKGSSYAIRVGTLNRNEGTTYKIEKVVSHERFNLDNMLNSDIAMLKTNKPIAWSKNVRSICLPENTYDEPHNKDLVVAGWGQTSIEDPDLPVMLQDVTLNIVSDGECSRKYKRKKYTIYRSQVCTWNYKQDACQGDSGGPAAETVDDRTTLIGIVSYGSTCADDFPGVYTQVSYFIGWIANTVINN